MPKQLNSRCKEFVASLIRYFEQERKNNGPFLPVAAIGECAAAALNLNISTNSTISRALKNNEIFKSPVKKRHFVERVTNTNILDTGAILNVIDEMYRNREHVTLSTLLAKLKDRQLFNECPESLSTLLKEIGFKFKKDDPRHGLMKRVEFLRSQLRKFKSAF